MRSTPDSTNVSISCSAIFFAIVELLTILLLLPNLSYENDWGKVINSFAQNGASRYGVVFPFDYTIVSNFNPLQAMVIESIQAGAKDFIVKPFQAERVIEAVKKVVG